MNRDPLYRKIVEALTLKLDGDVFERCAVALLGKAHPNLSPLHGGDDAGMDGAFGTEDGPYPLVCTTERDVLGNFRKNISNYLAKREGPKLAVVATSQQLSNKRKRNLEIEARKLGVRLINIYDSSYFADQLYRDNKWRLELLGVIGELPALSALPRRGRYIEPGYVVGRDPDIKWLIQAQSDVLVVGQPGSGKTYLHQHLAGQGHCLFAVDDSVHRLADAIREQEPSVIVVDDAHIHLALVEDLNRIRTELGFNYHLHVNCWPSYETVVQRILNIPDSQVRRLQRLPRQEIFELVKSTGIHGPDWLHYLIISQSDGKPGLAVALAELCKIENVASIWSGEAAARQLLGDLRLVKDEKERCVLAAFAIGGDTGIRFSHVSKTLHLSQLELRQITASLGAGGLVDEVGDDRLQVRPPAIRPVLVRETFFSGASSLSVEELLAGISSTANTATVLLDARQRGAIIDQSLLEDFVVSANSNRVWEHFAWVNEDCSMAVFDRYPRKVCHAAPGLLHHLPQRALDALLDADEFNLVLQAGAVEHPRRRIREWLFPFDGSPQITIERREILMAVLEDRATQKKICDGKTFTWALTEILQAAFDITRTSPGNSRQFQHIRGVASYDILKQIAAFWPRIKQLMYHVPAQAARNMFEQIECWCLPQRLSLNGGLTDESYEIVQKQGRAMLSDMLKMPFANRAWGTKALAISNWAQLDLEVDVDPVYDAIYAHRDHSLNWEDQLKKRMIELQAFADNVVRQPCNEVVDLIEELRSDAAEFGERNDNGYLWVIYQQLAKNCFAPDVWLNTLVNRRCPGEFLVPFVDRLSVDDPIKCAVALETLLAIPEFRSLAISRILRLPAPNEPLLDSTLALLEDPEFVEDLWLRDSDIPLAVMERMLEHVNPAVRGAAATGEWQREPTGSVRNELTSKWRAAVCDIDANHYALTDIFEKHPCLAFQWLQSQITRGNRRLSEHDRSLHAACKALEKDQRTLVLRAFTRDNYSDDCFDLVMGEHIDIFAEWLAFQSDKYLRLRPLDREVGDRWERMAIMALDAGVLPSELADHCTPNHWGGWGPLSQHFLQQIPAYEALAMHADARLRLAGKRGLAWVRSNADRELEEERREDIYGE